MMFQRMVAVSLDLASAANVCNIFPFNTSGTGQLNKPEICI